MNKEELRKEFEKERKIRINEKYNYGTSDGVAKWEYIKWLESKLTEPKQSEPVKVPSDELELLRKEVKNRWRNYPEEHPQKYGKYFIKRKDGKVHWETWNNTGFAYNNNVIIQWKEVI